MCFVQAEAGIRETHYGLDFRRLLFRSIENVQVLKGPQGTLFGRNTSAGAVLIKTADPRYDEISGRVSATYGRFDGRTGQAVLNLGLSDAIAVRRSEERRVGQARASPC